MKYDEYAEGMNKDKWWYPFNSWTAIGLILCAVVAVGILVGT